MSQFTQGQLARSRWLVPLLSLLLLPGNTGTAAPDVDPESVRFGIDVEAYRFDLSLTDDSDEIQGLATIAVRFTEAGVTELPIDLTSLRDDGRGMRVLAVRDANGGALQFTHVHDTLTIGLPAPTVVGALDKFTVEYRGIPAAGLRIGPNKHGDRTFFSDNWPNRARNWLPTVDHIGDKATSEFVVTAPTHYQVVSNGLLVEETDHLDGTRTSHWSQSVPTSPWLYVLGVARFAVERVAEFQGHEIQTWVYPQDRDEGFFDFAAPTKQALEFYDEYVGPFVYEKVANITSPATGGGMEAASAIMYSENMVTGERTERLRNVVIHEIAHQWFGNAVTESTWDDVWLSEGFATYFTLLFREHAYGRDDFVRGLEEAATRVWSWYDENPDYRIVHDNLDDMRRVTSIAIYQKGAWVLHMLRGRVGDDAFWRGIQNYYAAHINGTATTADFLRHMEEASGMEHDAFFDQWLHQGGNPSLSGSWSYDADRRQVRVDLEQVQDVGSFEFPLDIGIYSGAERTLPTLHTVQVSAGPQSFTFDVAEAPTDVRLDPGTWLLFRSEFGRATR